MDDMMYPSDGSYYLPTEPQAQAEERREATAKAQAAQPVLEDLIRKLEADIAKMGNVDTIKISPETDPEAFMKAWYGVQQVKAYAQQHKEYVESLLTITKR